jgi:two-component system invasion response regulator UvrY
MKKFLLIDDHDIVRAGIKTLLRELFRLCEIDEAGEGRNAVEKLKHHTYDLIIMDIQMPNTDTLGIMQFINIRYPGSKVMILSMSSEKIYARRFLKAGAKGFVSKEAPIEEIYAAINLIINGKKYISETLADTLAEESFSENPFNNLSAREFEIASLLLSGQGISEISKNLGLQASTVGTHKSRLFGKLGVSTILQLKELAVSYNL